jgi:hypothetical protein
MRRRSVLAVALALGVCAPDAMAQTTGASSAPPTQPAGGAVHATRNPETPARTVIVVGGILVSVGFALSWTGIGGLLWQATQHQSVRWAAPLSIASVPVEVVGSMLVLAGAVELVGQRSPDAPLSDPVSPPPAVATRAPWSVQLVSGEF